MKLLRAATYCKPELVFRPAQILKRLAWSRVWKGKEGRVTLPWGLEMAVDARDRIGMSITKIGVYDVAVLECLARLVDPGELCLDVGANAGLMTGVMACAAGPEGRVIAFEPHPGIFRKLVAHAERWRASGASLAAIDCREVALSDEAGRTPLVVPDSFAENEGTAYLERGKEADEAQVESMVNTLSLSGLPESSERIGVLKIDVEGHELAVLEGAAPQLEAGSIRDIVFEEHGAYPTPATDYLESRGYSVLLIRKGMLGPLLLPPNNPPRELPNFLATRDLGRATAKLRRFGYRVLRRMV